MARKSRIPDPLTIIHCISCRLPMNGKGYHGRGCQCDVKPGHAAEKAHSIPLNTSR